MVRSLCSGKSANPKMHSLFQGVRANCNVLTELGKTGIRFDTWASVHEDMMRFARSAECCALDQLSAHGLSPAPIGAGVD
jgi:hypothetical protein